MALPEPVPHDPGAGEVAYRRAERRLWDSLGVVPSEHRVRLDGLGCDVRIQEVGDGPPVLFLHGASTAGTSWAGLAAALPGWRCLLVDRPGTGLSEPLVRVPRDAGGMRALGAALLPSLLGALGLERAAVVATSLGGYFAFRGAIAAPERVIGLVELGWTPAARSPGVPMFMRLGSMPVLGRLMAAAPASEASVRRVFRQIGLRQALAAGKVSPEAIASYAALLNHTPTMRNELALGRAVVSPVRGLDPRLALSVADQAALTMRVLVAWGDSDPFGSLAVARRFTDGFPDARLVEIPGAGHAPWMDDPVATAELVDAFLRESLARTGSRDRP
jgi:pimeloyl-ACP methyl ester carboxylesterase